MEELLKVDVITSTHGIKGEVKVFPTTDDLQRFTYLRDCIMDTGKQFPQVCFVEIKESRRIFRPQIGKRLVVGVEHGVGRMH